VKTLNKISLFAIILAGFVVSGLAQAQTIYTERASFDSANPGLATEDFENGNVSPGGIIACDGPLDVTGDGFCFGSGDLLSGVIYTTTDPIKADEIALAAPPGNVLSKAILANTFVYAFVMDFDQPDNTAVGMDLICLFSADTVSIDIYGAGGLLTSESSQCTPSGVFFGVAAGEAITQIVITSPTNQAEGVDNLSFGVGAPPTGPASVARFAVTKDFSDNSPDNVTVNISCNTGLPLEQSFVISDSQSDPDDALVPSKPGVTFVVTSFTDGAMDCTITETAVDNYTVDYTAGGDSTSVDDDPNAPGCHFNDVNFEDINTCEISNAAQNGTFTVNKIWNIFNEDAGSEVYEQAHVELWCDAEITNGGSYDENSENWYLSAYLDDGDDLTATVSTLTGTANCWAYEHIYESGVESTGDCGSRPIVAGGSSSCTFTNTVFFEGIPTLSQYGLALMALLMLGVGFVGFRRFV